MLSDSNHSVIIVFAPLVARFKDIFSVAWGRGEVNETEGGIRKEVIKFIDIKLE